ncbi:N-acetylmuramoyl-L-alanine amidase [Candidatus Bipolaricaulota bacterium]|nr:N-acetylmuramoyl-L-alanine amidase [Candidatus Bipolaricaulota bacterium]
MNTSLNIRTFSTLFLLVLLLSTLAYGVVGADCFIDSSNPPVVKSCPASTNNYRLNTRSAREINYIVIHTVQGSLGSAVNTFSSPNLGYPRSAHYTIGESGEVIKSVPARKIAWHAGTSPPGSGGTHQNKVLNENSIGIEHAGYVDDPNFPTEKQYRASAALTRYLCELYDIPIDREHIVGHEEIKSTKGDPGPNWNWNYYMDLVKHGSRKSPEKDVGVTEVLRPAEPNNFLAPGLLLLGAGLTVLSFVLSASG